MDSSGVTDVSVNVVLSMLAAATAADRRYGNIHCFNDEVNVNDVIHEYGVKTV